MLKFCDSDPCALVTHLFSITIKREGNEYIPTAEQLFPKSDPDQNLIKNIQLFAFPDHCAIESKSFITFVIGDTHVDFKIGYALYSNSFSARCILSNYYYPNLFESLLSLSDDALMSKVESLSKSEVRKNVQIKKNSVFYLDEGRQKQQFLKLIYDTFSSFDIAKIIIAMLQARHIFVVSSSATICCKFAAGLPFLIEPFCWDMNTIPILPLKLKEACQVPVPTLIGLTRPEVLLEGRVSPHIIVNVDLKLVIDNPSLDSHDFTKRSNVLMHMIKFKDTSESVLKPWNNCPGFPHKQVQMHIQKFIASYLQIYTGPVSTLEDLITALAKVPEFLESSQVIQGLLSKEHATLSVTKAFEKWFDDVFKKKSIRKTVKLMKKAATPETNQPINSNEGNSGSNIKLEMKSTSQESVNLLEFSKNPVNNNSLLIRKNDSSPQLVDFSFNLNDQNGDKQEHSNLINFDQVSTDENENDTENQSILSQSSEDLLLDFNNGNSYLAQGQIQDQTSSPDLIGNQSRGFVQNHSVDDLVGITQQQGSPIRKKNENVDDIFGLFDNNKPNDGLPLPSSPITKSGNTPTLNSRVAGQNVPRNRNAPPSSQSIDFSDLLSMGTASTPPPSDKRLPPVSNASGLASASMSFQPVFNDNPPVAQQQFQQFNNNDNNNDIFGFGNFSPTQQNKNPQQQQQKQNDMDDPFGFFK
ncbi:hypothetical protein M9Y10_043373 [Tritrichomonas musculus]|uniref:UDENN domain-containing protein n=1 Tax=Tritrichomonas musculus TaxID=1915356 RepID=A0ABR2JZH8_9EUKA